MTTTDTTAAIEIHRVRRWVGNNYHWEWIAAVRYAGQFPIGVGDFNTKADARKAAEAFIIAPTSTPWVSQTTRRPRY